jgi:HD-like signal output (HDOD) protein
LRVPIDPAAFARLPSLPAVAVKLLQHFSLPDVSLAAVADILRPDPALTARLLKAASSAEFGIGRPITDAKRAVQLLGVRRVTSLALSFLLSDDASKPGTAATHYRETWIRSVVQAMTMERLAASRARGSEAEHFTTGLLLEVGALALLRGCTDQYVQICEDTWQAPNEREAIELQRLGCTQSDVSVALFRQWKLPAFMTEAVRRRRLPLIELSQSTSAAHRAVIEGAALATAVGDYYCTGQTGSALIRAFELGESFYRMDVAAVRQLLAEVHARVQQGASLFNTDVSRLGTPDDLMRQAQSQLEQRVAAWRDEDDATLDNGTRARVQSLKSATELSAC